MQHRADSYILVNGVTRIVHPGVTWLNDVADRFRKLGLTASEPQTCGPSFRRSPVEATAAVALLDRVL